VKERKNLSEPRYYKQKLNKMASLLAAAEAERIMKVMSVK
jgi:hypothetical protein